MMGVINNGNNTIFAPGDQKIIGNTAPRCFGISTPSVGWSNFFLSAFFQGILHRGLVASGRGRFLLGSV